MTKPVLPKRSDFDQYLDVIFSSGTLTNFGPLEQKLTSQLCDYLEVDNLLLVANGTKALEVAVQTYCVENNISKKNDFTFDTTPFSFAATSSALDWIGLSCNFIDVNQFGTVDLRDFEPTRQNKSLLATNVYGNACDFDLINKTYGEMNVIYDSSHCFGVMRKNNILKQGYANTLSFHATKVFTTCEGGAIIFKNKSSFELAKKLINFGISSPNEIIPHGTNAKLSELHAAYGLALLPSINSALEARRSIGEFYLAELKNIGLSSLLIDTEMHRANFAYFPVLFPDEETLVRCISALERLCIYPRRYFYPCLNGIGYDSSKDLPVADSLSSRVLCLPIYPGIEPHVAQAIVEVLSEFK